MKVTVEVANRQQAEAVRRVFADPQTRALVLVIGTLLGLPTERARERVLRFTADALEEQ